MAGTVSPTNPGLVTDPRNMATSNWLNAVQNDLNGQVKELAINPTGDKIGNWMPIDREIFNPAKYPHGFMPGKINSSTQVGMFGSLVRIG